MSAKYTKVKNYYDKGLWTARQVKDAVTKGWITEEEYAEIISESEAEEAETTESET